MMRYVILLALLLCLPIRGEAWQVVGGTSGYPDVTFHWSAENSYVSDKPTGITATTNQSPAFSASPAKVGSYSLHRDGAWDSVTFAVDSAHVSNSAGQMAFWFRYTGIDNNAIFISRINFGAQAMTLMKDTSSPGKLKLVWNGPEYEYIVTDTALSADAWYYVIVKWDSSAASPAKSLELSAYNTDGTLSASASSTTSRSAFANDASSVAMGHDSGDADAYYIDNFIISKSTSFNSLASRDEISYN